MVNNDKQGDKPSYIAASQWEGIKTGYYFTTSEEHGTGYHWDTWQANNPKPKPYVTNKKKESASQPSRGRAQTKNNAARGRSLSPPRSSGGGGGGGKRQAPPSVYDYDAIYAVPKHKDDETFYDKVVRCIPSEFVLIASQDDKSKALEDLNAMEHFKITPPPGQSVWGKRERAGSVATTALLQLFHQDPNAFVALDGTDTSASRPYDVCEILKEIQDRIYDCTQQEANPTITASRPLGPPSPKLQDGEYMPYYVVPPSHHKGTRRALLIACVSGEGEKDLKGTPNDVLNIQRFLQTHCGFAEENMTVLIEDRHYAYRIPADRQPTKKHITDAFKKMTTESKPGDVNFIQFSGHGNRNDTNLYIMPSDYKESGYIQDERILKNLIKAMPKGVYTTMLVDCCYSGTIGDLPYILKPESTDQTIETDFRTSIFMSKEAKAAAKAIAKEEKANRQRGRGRGDPRGRGDNKRRMLQPRQSIRTFYDTDTREETLEKEAKKDPAYEKLKEHRKKLTSMLLFEPKKLNEYTQKAFDSAKDKTKKAYSAAKRGVRSLSPIRSRSDNKSKDNKDPAIRDSATSNASSTASGGSSGLASIGWMRGVTNKDKEGGKGGGGTRGRSPGASKKKATFDDDIPIPSKNKKKTTTGGGVKKTLSASNASDHTQSTVASTGSNSTVGSSKKNKTTTTKKTNTNKAKSPVRKTQSTGSTPTTKGGGGGATPIKPTNSGGTKKKVLKMVNDDDDDAEFEAAIKAAQKNKKNKPRSVSPPKGARPPSRSNSPPAPRVRT